MFRLAKPGRILNERIQHRLEIERRAAYDFQHFARRRLLLEGLGEVAVASLQFLEQPHVLDGDHGLVGEGFEKGDLFLRERTDLRSANHNRPDGNTLAEQWRSKNSSSHR